MIRSSTLRNIIKGSLTSEAEVKDNRSKEQLIEADSYDQVLKKQRLVLDEKEILIGIR